MYFYLAINLLTFAAVTKLSKKHKIGGGEECSSIIRLV